MFSVSVVTETTKLLWVEWSKLADAATPGESCWFGGSGELSLDINQLCINQ